MYGAKISSIRLARGFTQEYVAKKADLDQRTYSQIENDRKINIDDTLLQKIADVLGVSVDDIKSPTPIIMTFNNNPQSCQYTTNNVDDKVIQALLDQLKIKDELIAELLKKIK